MLERESLLSAEAARPTAQDIQHNLRRLERHDWSLWGAAFTVILALTGTIIALSVSVKTQPGEPFFRFYLDQSVRGLAGMILIFTVYTIYQEIRLKSVRSQLAAQINATAEQYVRAEAYLKLAMHDPLTGLYNRRYGEERLEAELARLQRHGGELTVLLLDLNGFKQVNDSYGHPAGDTLLKEFAYRLNKSIRGADLAVRLGGDEFMVILPDCTTAQVQHVLMRLRPLEVEFDGVRIPATFAAGWTSYQSGESPQKLIERADAALYVDKKHFRRDALTA